MTYQEKLKDPRWQKKRLKILERDGWACQCCGSKKKTLTVHHVVYEGDPWEAREDDLQALCEDCHSALGPHPKGGVKWIDGVFRYIHCPVCGCEEVRDKGTFDKCNECGHRMFPDEWPGDVEAWGPGFHSWATAEEL